MREQKIMERSHHLNLRLNKVFSLPLFAAGFVMTVVLFLSPYWLRTMIAFITNILFNRPLTYHFYFFEKLGKKMNGIVLFIFYIFIFGIYAALIQVFRKKTTGNSTWEVAEALDAESHFYQS